MVIHYVLNVVNLIVLGKLAVEDIRYLSISLLETLTYLSGGIIYGLLRMDVFDLVLSIIPGIFLLFLAYITNQKIGYGDALIILANGLWLGSSTSAIAIFISMLLILTVSLVIIFIYGFIKKKAINDMKIACVPFIFAGTMAAQFM